MSCARCNKTDGITIILRVDNWSWFGSEAADWKAGPAHTISCIECLTNTEITRMLQPVALFVVQNMISRSERLDDSGQRILTAETIAMQAVCARIQSELGYDFTGDGRADALAAVKGIALGIRALPDPPRPKSLRDKEREEEIATAVEALWQERQGEDYGTY